MENLTSKFIQELQNNLEEENNVGELTFNWSQNLLESYSRQECVVQV